MKKLLLLELKKINIQTYLTASLIISLVMISLLYLFAYAPRLDPSDADLLLFSGYSNITILFGILNMAVFGSLAAVIYSKILIEEYSGKQLILLFSYPVNRGKIIVAKLGVVSLFIFVYMMLSNLVILTLFAGTEFVFPIVEETMSISFIPDALFYVGIMSLVAVSIGILAVGIGFVKKSVPTTILSSVLIASLLSNVLLGTGLKIQGMLFLAVLLVSAAGVVSVLMIRNVKKLEIA